MTKDIDIEIEDLYKIILTKYHDLSKMLPDVHRVVFHGLEGSPYDIKSINEGLSLMKDGRLTIDGLRLLRHIAMNGSLIGEGAFIEKRIAPLVIYSTEEKTLGWPSPFFFYFCSQESFNTLKDLPRGFLRECEDINGNIGKSNILGKIIDVIILSAPSHIIKIDDKMYSWDLFLGSQTIENECKSYEGLRYFPSFKDETKMIEYGLIHSFVRVS